MKEDELIHHLSDAQVDLRVVDILHASAIDIPNAGLQPSIMVMSAHLVDFLEQ